MRRALLLLTVSFAVLLMHSAFGAHCAAAAPMSHGEHRTAHGAMTHDGPAASDHRPSITAAADVGTADKAAPPTDCMMAASCTFVLPGGTAIVAVAILVLLAFAPRDLFVRLVIPRRIVLGRPPPWAIATYLHLGVLRLCSICSLRSLLDGADLASFPPRSWRRAARSSCVSGGLVGSAT